MNVLISIFLIVGAFAIAALAANDASARTMPQSLIATTATPPIAIGLPKGRIPADVAKKVLGNASL